MKSNWWQVDYKHYVEGRGKELQQSPRSEESASDSIDFLHAGVCWFWQTYSWLKQASLFPMGQSELFNNYTTLCSFYSPCRMIRSLLDSMIPSLVFRSLLNNVQSMVEKIAGWVWFHLTKESIVSRNYTTHGLYQSIDWWVQAIPAWGKNLILRGQSGQAFLLSSCSCYEESLLIVLDSSFDLGKAVVQNPACFMVSARFQ